MGPADPELALRVVHPSKSRSRSRPHTPHTASASSVPYLPQGPDALLLPEGSVSDEAVELLQDFVHRRHRDKHRSNTDDTLVADEAVAPDDSGKDSDDDDDDDEADDEEELKQRPWYRRPSPLWLLCMMPFSSIAMSACIAPRVEIYTLLACIEHKPEYTAGHELPANATFGSEVDFDYSTANSPFYAIYNGPGLDDAVGVKDSDTTSKCATDPVVQAAVAKLIAFTTTAMGVLTCLTTAFWGSLSDRYGRLRVMGISILGLLLTDFNFIFVYFFSNRLPGGYWFLLLGPLVEGSLGGLSSAVAAIHAYMADCTAPGTRSRVFSLSLGLLFVGMAIGPSVGALLIHATAGRTITVFYFATAVHLLYALMVWVVVPESLTKRARKAMRRRRVREAEEARRVEAGDSARAVRIRIRILVGLKKVFAFLSPLSIFAPMKVEADDYSGNGNKKRTTMDWSLTLIAAAYGFSSLVLSSYQYKFQYAAATFGWTSEELGYWLSLVGASRAVYLTVVLPLIIKFFNRPKPAIQLPSSPSEPLISGSSRPSSPYPSSLTNADTPHPAHTSHPHSDTRTQTQTHQAPTPHTPSFDLSLARTSLALEAVCYTIIPLAPGALSFSALSILAAWGGGFGPAIQALALELYVRRGAGEQAGGGKGVGRQGRGGETGRLFGAMSVVNSLCAQIIGPTLFGTTYVKTVGTYPRTIFWVSAACVCVSLLCVCLVRLPVSQGAHAHHNVDTDVDADVDVDVERAALLVDEDTVVHRPRAKRVAVVSESV